MIGLESGTVIRTREDSSYLVRPSQRDKIIQVKDCPENLRVNDKVEFAVTAFRPWTSTDTGVYIDESFKPYVQIVNGEMIHYARVDFFSCNVIPEMRAITYSSIDELAKDFPKKGELPILMMGTSEYLTLHRASTPFIITTKNHPIYGAIGKSGKKIKFKGSELLTKLVLNESMQIKPSGNAHYVNSAKTRTYPFMHLLRVSSTHYMFHLLAGTDPIRKQFDEWEIERTPEIDKFLKK